MEGEKLPPSLLLLQIDHCGLLGKHCKNKHQLIWPKISHIPDINGHQGIDNCYAGGFAFFLVSTIKMCIRKLLW
ncbi:hypothetical protein Ahy_A02g009199 [Arachis hypogaea]|uniref:Uncharacterized protein n=1 Tax=Arachis hypogaea TaxID=3818 RepID=A0A445EGB6_ARAHY|nr:hypothetical protein Ahy_A02g009199 [Arachis hypogaea]